MMFGFLGTLTAIAYAEEGALEFPALTAGVDSPLVTASDISEACARIGKRRLACSVAGASPSAPLSDADLGKVRTLCAMVVEPAATDLSGFAGKGGIDRWELPSPDAVRLAASCPTFSLEGDEIVSQDDGVTGSWTPEPAAADGMQTYTLSVTRTVSFAGSADVYTLAVKSTGVQPEDVTDARAAIDLPETLRSALHSIDQQAILMALTDVLVERAVAEFRAWAVRDALGDVCSPRAGDFEPIPTTCALLGDDRPDLSLLASGASALRASARKDLISMPRRLAEWQLVSDRVGWPSDHQALSLLAVSGRTNELVLDGSAPLAAFGGWAATRDYVGHDAELEPALAAAYAASVFVASWPRSDDGIQTPLGADGQLDDGMLSKALAAFVVNLAWRNERAGNPYGEWNVPVGDLGRIVTSLTDLAERSATLTSRIEELLAADELDERALVRAYAELTAEVAGVFVDLTPVFPGGSDALPHLNAIERMARSVASADYGAAALELLAELEAISTAANADPEVLRSLANLRRGLALVLGLSKAEDSTAARAAIDDFVAPVGSFTRKHDGGGGYAGLGAYVGVSGGGEVLLGPVEEKDPRWSGSGWPTAMVGADFGHRHAASPLYVGGFVSALDVGALASWRLQQCLSDQPAECSDEGAGDKDDDGESGAQEVVTGPEKIKLEHVFAPGVWIVVAPWDAPFAFTAGASFSPRLRVATEAPGEAFDVVRVGVGLTVDIPLLP